MTHSGRCYCGKINYEFEEPIYTQILCHCKRVSIYQEEKLMPQLLYQKITLELQKGP